MLPEEFKHFSSAWESTAREERTLENLISRLILEEIRSGEREEMETAVALKSVEKKCFKCGNTGHISKTCKNNKKGKKCFICNKEGHFASTCFKKGKEKHSTCLICKKDNHLEKDCYFRHKDKDEKKFDKHNAGISFLTEMQKKSTRWIMDSGSTSHMSTSMEGRLLRRLNQK
jgi:cellular nucleic acid-binding protein